MRIVRWRIDTQTKWWTYRYYTAKRWTASSPHNITELIIQYAAADNIICSQWHLDGTVSQRSIGIHHNISITLLHQNQMLLKLPDVTKPHTLTDSYRRRKLQIWFGTVSWYWKLGRLQQWVMLACLWFRSCLVGIGCSHRLVLFAPYCLSSDLVYHVNFHLTLEILLSFYYNSPHHCCREELTCILLAVILLEAMTYIYSVSYQYFYQHLRFISRVNCGDF